MGAGSSTVTAQPPPPSPPLSPLAVSCSSSSFVSSVAPAVVPELEELKRSLQSSSSKLDWDEKYPRASVQANGSIYLLSSTNCIYCPLPPLPYPPWLVQKYNISPGEWFKLVWGITEQSFNIQREHWRHLKHKPTFLAAHSKDIGAYITSIASDWLQRGLRIQYHENVISDLCWNLKGTKFDEEATLDARMHNWLEFTPADTPARQEGSYITTSPYPVPILSLQGGLLPMQENANQNLPVEWSPLRCQQCSETMHLSKARFCHQCAAPLK